MREEQFREFTEEVIQQQLFHVYPTDIDDEGGGRLDEAILVKIIAQNSWCLKYKPLQWFLDTFLISEEEWDKQIKNDMGQIKKTEIILREDITIYGEYDYIDLLRLKLDIVNGKIKEKLYYRNEHGGSTPIDEFGCSSYRDFPQVNELLHKIIVAQMEKRKNEIQEKELFRQIQSDEREGEVCPDCMGTGEVMGSSEIGSVTTHQKCFGCKGTGRKK